MEILLWYHLSFTYPTENCGLDGFQNGESLPFTILLLDCLLGLLDSNGL